MNYAFGTFLHAFGIKKCIFSSIKKTTIHSTQLFAIHKFLRMCYTFYANQKLHSLHTQTL